MLANHCRRPAVQHGVRAFSSTSRMSADKLRIGYIPEHFATPLHFAYDSYGLSEHATLRSFPSGTGTMIEAFHKSEIDVGIGLTEAWIVGLSKTPQGTPRPYHMVGSYTLSPLTWAISVGANSSINSVEDLRGKKVGVSRMGSGSHIMSSVLAQKQGWLKDDGSMPFQIEVCGPFAPLREAVNGGKADFFMWEHFTTKKSFDSGELKRVGELPTPWNAWHTAARGERSDERVGKVLLPALEKGIREFETNKTRAVQYITENMEYSKEDAEEWYEGVQFAGSSEINTLNPATMKDTCDILKTAGVMGDRELLVSNLGPL